MRDMEREGGEGRGEGRRRRDDKEERPILDWLYMFFPIRIKIIGVTDPPWDASFPVFADSLSFKTRVG